jgi:ABC-type multidrug transport system fused ATPase/permease subunit
VGERGLGLSGGQIQRICIARAFIRNGDLMIFDEATSALDKKNEQEIFDVFKQLAKSGKIIIVISHNLKTNQNDLNSLILQK